MHYVMKILTLMDRWRVAVLGAVFGALLLFAVINWLHDPYRRQNKKLRNCVRNMRAQPAKAALFMAALPQDYRRQWRAFVNCGTDKPATVFEFVPKRKRVLALWLLVAAALVCSAYVVVFALVSFNPAYIVVQAVLWLAVTLIFLLEGSIARRNSRRAKQLFGQMVAQLTAVTPKNPGTIAEDTVSALTKLNKGIVTDAVVGRASEILHSKGLSEPRTVDEQRRINVALNGLLQNYAHLGGGLGGV